MDKNSNNNIIEYAINPNLSASTFLNLVNKIWPGKYNIEKSEIALKKTINITAWHHKALIGCVRLLTDGYFFSTITEILVHPNYQNQGIGSKLMEMAFKKSPSSLSFGVQPGNEAFFIKLGYGKGIDSYQKKKDRNSKNTQ